MFAFSICSERLRLESNPEQAQQAQQFQLFTQFFHTVLKTNYNYDGRFCASDAKRA